jgi:glutamyl-tRNA reductase
MTSDNSQAQADTSFEKPMREHLKGMMIYSGAHYSLCPVEIREIWAQGYSLPEGPQTLKKIIAETVGDSSTEMVVISTCNRFDLCLFGQLNQEKITDVFVNFAQWTLVQKPVLQNFTTNHKNWFKDIAQWLRIFIDKDAVLHLFRVGSSLDSLVLGEPHILGQIKDAFRVAAQLGFCHQEATATFNRSFQVAKKVRSDTELGKNGISIGHAAVDIVQRIFDNLSSLTCLVLGAGEMAKISSQHLRYCGAGKITIANRTLSKAEELAQQISSANALSLEQGLKQLAEFDIIIAATSAQEFIVKNDLHSELLNRRRLGTPCVLVDISVPRNIDPQLGQLDNIFVFDVDDLDKVMESSRQSRKTAALKAEEIINAEVCEFISHRRRRENLSYIGQFHVTIKEIVKQEIFKSLKSGRTLTDDQIQITAEAVAKKLIAHPAQLARAETRIETDSNTIGEIVNILFNLDKPHKDSLSSHEKGNKS